MYNLIKKRAKKIADDLAGQPDYFLMDSHLYSLFIKLEPVLSQYTQGKCLDVGAGRLAYKPLIEKRANQYISLDIERKSPALDYLGDAHHLPFKDNSFETVFCSQVLEHVVSPKQVLKEIYRVLKPDGQAIISAPHIGYLHNEPNDYFRFTHYGLTYLIKGVGLKPILIQPAGGLLSLLGAIPSKIILPLTYGLPGWGRLIFFFNKIWVKFIVWLDNHLERKKLFALNFILVAKKE